MRLLYDSKHFHIILICQWRGVICEMAEVTFVAETLRHACEFLGHFTHIDFSYFVCGFCGFSGFWNRNNRNNSCLCFCVFSKQANPHDRFFFYRLCRFALLSYNLITSLPRTSYTLSLALFHMSVEMTCRVMENSIYSLDINIISRISTLSWLHSVLYQIVGVEISTIQFQCA